MKKKLILIISVNALLVTLAVLLSYRMIVPTYESKQLTNLNSLGSLHTEAAAERLASFVSLLKEELKENVIRLIDPSRGPVFLDPSRWLWIRIQDKEWRAEGNLEPLPLPRTDVDTWALGQGKSSLVLSLRIPIMKQGVQDFVLIEGGVKLSAFHDLQNDKRFGLWIFDLNSYKKGGLSSAKIFEQQSESGTLAKEEMATMTSEFLTKLFNSKESQELSTDLGWSVYFKKSTSNDQLGVLGFWIEELEPQKFNSRWIILIFALVVVAGLSSMLIFKLLTQESPLPPGDDTQVRDDKTVEKEAPALTHNPSPRLVTQQQPASVIQISRNPTNSSQATVVTQAPAPAVTKSDSKKDIKRFVKALCSDLANSLEGKAAYSVERVLLFMDEKEVKFENFDLEISFHEFVKNENFPRVESFFDQDLWRVHSNNQYLMALFSLYIEFLTRNSSSGEVVRLSARYNLQDTMDMDCVDLKRSIFFKEPFNRVIFYAPAKEVYPKKRIHELFETSSATPKIENVELPFSLDAVDLLHARLKMKSNAQEGHVIYLDIPVSEARRPEDIIYIKQLKGLIPIVSEPTDSLPVVEEVKFETPVVTPKVVAPKAEVSPPPSAPTPAPATPPQQQEKPPETVVAKENTEEAMKSLRLSEIERVSSFAEGISDERTRARSRFRIKRPGEKS